jgi:hypothetical protein
MNIIKKIITIITFGLLMLSINAVADDINTHVGEVGILSDINNQYQLQNPKPAGVSFKDMEWTALTAGGYDATFQLQKNLNFSLRWKGPDFTLTINNSSAMLPNDNWKLIFFVDNNLLEEHTIVSGVDIQQFIFNTVNSNANSLRAEIQLNGKTIATKDLKINDDYGFEPDSIDVALNEKKSYHFNIADEIRVEYVDTLGNLLSKDEVMIEDYSESYSTNPKSISGYHLVKVEGNENGTYDASKHIVKYIYEKNTVSLGLVNIYYQDINGNSIASNEVKKGAVGSIYSTDKKEIKGYTFKEVKGDVSGSFIDGSKDVYYIYEKIIEKPVLDKPDGEDTTQISSNNKTIENNTIPASTKQQSATNVENPKKEVLPETGASDYSLWMVMVGEILIILSLSILFLKNSKI